MFWPYPNFEREYNLKYLGKIGEVFVADTRNHRIQKFTSNGDYIAQWGGQGVGDGQFNFPYGVAISSSTHHVFVADTDNHRIQRFDSHLHFVTKWGIFGSDKNQFKYPRV